MMKILSLIVLLCVVSPSVKAGGHFEIGNKLTIAEIDGYVRYYCSDDYVPGTFRFETRHCKAHEVDPDGQSYFVTDEFVDADWVNLTATHPDGSKRNKTVGFDAKKQRSTKAFNLLYPALFSKPLLSVGLNQVDVVLGKGKEHVSEETIKVSVDQGPPRRCASALYNTTQTCNTYSVSICRRYFEDHNYCH